MVRIEGPGSTYGNYAPGEPGPIKHSQSPFSSMSTPKEQFINIANKLLEIDPGQFRNLENQLESLISKLEPKDRQKAEDILDNLINLDVVKNSLSIMPNKALEEQCRNATNALVQQLNDFKK